jgi:acetamidase/formamidase
MIKGDPGVEDIYEWTKDGQNVPMRGKSGVGDGVHVLTGPIYVCDAEPGDVLQIDILDLKPRKNPSTGKTYGSNAAANCEQRFAAERCTSLSAVGMGAAVGVAGLHAPICCCPLNSTPF